MPSRAILTVAATTAATLGGGLASAGTAAAATAPHAARVPPAVRAAAGVPPTAPPPGIFGIDDDLDVADNWCISPLSWSGPVTSAILPTAARACDRKPVRADGGTHVLDGLCLAPIALDGLPGSGPGAPCGTPDAKGPVSALRGFSVAGVQVTY
ncbi:hypothetical protein [Catenulispora subtropica]|uniref:Secreted protein n=1 Tax=Catenulispora subtropica TaxID=450798 RepID=A0ABN2QFS8_9ACTN